MKVKKILICFMTAAMFLYCSNIAVLANQNESIHSAIEIKPDNYEKNEIELFNVIPIEHYRTIDDIVKMDKMFPHGGFGWETTRYNETPKFTSPYYAGSLNKDDIADAENAMKMVRYLAGVPYEDVCFRDDLNNIAQHGAVLLAASDQFSHYPTQPDDMDDEFYSLGYQGCREANIYAGISNISYGVLGWVYDDGANNIERAGHRRWILNPGNQNFGIGYAQSTNASYGGYRANMHVFDGMGPWSCASDSYIAWPSAGNFPIQYFAASEYIDGEIVCPWSINLGQPYAIPDKEDVELKLTRHRDNKVWIFNADTPNLGIEGLSDTKMHLSVDSDGYGITKAIIFRPDIKSLGIIKDGDTFTVKLSGIKTSTGKATTLEYDINFFDLEKEKNRSSITFKVQHNGNNVENAKVTIGGTSAYTNVNGEAVIRVNNNKKYTYTITKDDYNSVSDTISVETSSIDKNIDLRIIERMLVNKDGELYQVASDREKLTIASVIDDIKVVTITADAFEKCDNLKELTLFENITSIEDDAFDDFKNLKLYVKKDSYAHRFAVRKGIDYEFITYMVGDVYTDGVVNSKDAIRLAQFIAKWKVELSGDEEKASDIIADGNINSKDIIKLNQYIAKWNVSLE